MRQFLGNLALGGGESGIGDVGEALWGVDWVAGGGGDAFEVQRVFASGGALGSAVAGIGGSFDSGGVGLWADSGVVAVDGGQVSAGEAGDVG